MRKFDDILTEIGAFGKYQKLICLLLLLSTVPNGFWAMISIFSHVTPPHHCRLPQLENLAQSNNVSTSSEQYQRWLNVLIPMEKNQDNEYTRSTCFRYNGTFEWNGTDVVLHGQRKHIACDHGWSYEIEQGSETITTEWDLVCSRAWFRPFSMSLYMAGVLVGSFVSGILSDRYGRRPVFLWGTLIQFGSMVLTSFSANIIMYCVCFLVSGLTGLVNYVAAFVIGTEISDSSKRAFMGVIEVAGFTIGYMILPVFAYFIHDWRTLYRVIGFGGVLFIPYYWWVPESPRWLLKAGKIKEAVKIIKIIAKFNGNPLADDHNILREKTEQKLLEKSDVNEETMIEATHVTKYTYTDLLRHKATRRRTIIMFLQWFVSSLVYYCISLNTPNLGGNNYVVCFTAAAVELPAYLFIYISADKAGRRSVMTTLLFTSAACCLISPFLRQASDTVGIVIAMFGKFAISGAFALVYIYCCELFPTMMRNMGLGSASTMARVGAIISPYLVFAGEQIDKNLPFIIMGILGIAAAISSFGLPETKSLNLPETLEDALEQERHVLEPVRRCLGHAKPEYDDETKNQDYRDSLS